MYYTMIGVCYISPALEIENVRRVKMQHAFFLFFFSEVYLSFIASVSIKQHSVNAFTRCVIFSCNAIVLFPYQLVRVSGRGQPEPSLNRRPEKTNRQRSALRRFQPARSAASVQSTIHAVAPVLDSALCGRESSPTTYTEP